MKLEKQTLSIEQARHLQELGLDMSDAALGWYPVQIGITDDGFPMYSEKEFTIHKRNIDDSYNIPTYTLQEVLDSLPPYIDAIGCEGVEETFWLDLEWGLPSYSSEGIAIDGIEDIEWGESYFDDLYRLLCWVLENGYLEEEKK